MPANANNELFRLLADEALMAILLLNEKGQLEYANRLAHSLFEMPNDFKFENFDVKKLCPNKISDQKIRTFSESSLEMQGMFQEIAVQKLNGNLFISSLGIKHVENKGQKHIILMFQDITLQKKLQREILEKQNAIHQAYQDLLEQNRQLKELDTAKNRFIAMTTHELRTPLSAMVASAEILDLKLYDGDEQRDEFTKMIYDQGQHLLTLVNDILDFAKIQAGKMDYYVEEKDAYTLAARDVENLQHMAEAGQVTLKIEPKKDSDNFQCFFDELRLTQVVSNLINNAVKYNRTNGHVTVWLSQTDDAVDIHVKDTGKGIAQDDLKKVFNEFETLGKVANHSKGTGLGLPISKRLIESMGGKLSLESEPGVGSHFWISIPKKKVLALENYRSRIDSLGDLAA